MAVSFAGSWLERHVGYRLVSEYWEKFTERFLLTSDAFLIISPTIQSDYGAVDNCERYLQFVKLLSSYGLKIFPLTAEWKNGVGELVSDERFTVAALDYSRGIPMSKVELYCLGRSLASKYGQAGFVYGDIEDGKLYAWQSDNHGNLYELSAFDYPSLQQCLQSIKLDYYKNVSSRFSDTSVNLQLNSIGYFIQSDALMMARGAFANALGWGDRYSYGYRIK